MQEDGEFEDIPGYMARLCHSPKTLAKKLKEEGVPGHSRDMRWWVISHQWSGNREMDAGSQLAPFLFCLGSHPLGQGQLS